MLRSCARRFNELALVDVIDPEPRPFFDRPWLVLGADRLADACLALTTLASRRWRGAIDQWTDSTDVLTAPVLDGLRSVDAGGDEAAHTLRPDEAIED